MAVTETILFVEDDSDYALARQTAFEIEGYDVEIVADGPTAFRRAQEKRFDVIVLDVHLLPVEPPMDGYQVCRALRKHNNDTPILMLTADDQVVFGLKCGADEYVKKSCPSAELMARVGALLRRAAIRNAVPSEPQIYSFANITIDLLRHEVRRNGEPVEITPIQFELLLMFVRNPGRCFTRQQALAKVWNGDESKDEHVVDQHVMYLRQKLERNPKTPVYLVTVPRVGFRFDAKVSTGKI